MIAHSGVDHVAVSALAAVAVGGLRAGGGASSPGCVLAHLVLWIGGVALVVLVASLPVFETLAEQSFTGHMVQHLLVIVGAAPLLVVGPPVRHVLLAGWIPPTAFGRRRGASWAAWRRSG